MRTNRCILLLALTSAPFAITVQAQSNQGALAGNVLDATQSAIPGAVVTARNTANGQVFTATSTSAGDYRFPSLDIGAYEVSVTAPGFATTRQSGVHHPDPIHDVAEPGDEHRSELADGRGKCVGPAAAD